MEIIEQIKAISKEGADLSEIETALTGLNPLASIKDKDAAWGLIKSNDILLSTLDQKVTERVKTAEENIMNGKFQEAMKAREAELRAELVPNETPEQKRIRELEENLSSRDKRDQEIALKDELSNIAEEAKVNTSLARKLSPLGEQAKEVLGLVIEWHKAEIASALDGKAASQYGNGEAPKAKPVKPEDIDAQIIKARAEGNATLALKLQMQKSTSQ